MDTKTEFDLSPIDELFGKSALDRFSTLITIFLAGLNFGIGFWLAYRWIA